MGKTDKPNIESRMRFLREQIRTPSLAAAQLAQEELATLGSELESLRAENEALRELVTDLESDKERMRGTISARTAARDTERARADALAARVEALKTLLAAWTTKHFEDERVCRECFAPIAAHGDGCEVGRALSSTPSADLEAHDAQVRGPLERELAELRAYRERERNDLRGLAGSFTEHELAGRITPGTTYPVWPSQTDLGPESQPNEQETE